MHISALVESTSPMQVLFDNHVVELSAIHDCTF